MNSSESADRSLNLLNTTQPQRSRGRVWLFRLAAVSFGIVPLLLIELILRLCGVGRDLALVIPVRNAPGWYQLNSRFDEAFFGQLDLSGPENQPFQLPKPEGTRRILVVGGSTVVGFPYPSELSFSRHLQAALAAQSEENMRIEVINAGITAMNSSAEVAVVQEGLKIQPDAIVVYTGHNEFYGPGGAASSSGLISPRWFRIVAAWRRLRSVQTLRRLTKSTAPPTDLLESLPGDLHIGIDSTTFRQGVSRFEENLSVMAQLAGKARIPILFVSPVANEHDQPPIENLGTNSESGEDGWRRSLFRGEQELLSGNPTNAIEYLAAAMAERPQNPIIRFRLAHAYEKAGRTEEAIEQFAKALDFDGCRFRASSAFRTTMKEVAKQHRTTGASFLDLHSTICQNSDYAVPGRKHFLEHVHFTWEGNRLVGSEIARTLWTDVWKREWSPEKILDEQAMGERLAVQDEDHLAALTLAVAVYQKLPFREGVDASLLAKELISETIARFRRLSPDRQYLFEKLSQQDMSSDLLDELIRGCRSTGNETLLGDWLMSRVTRQPWRCDAIDALNRWHKKHGHTDAIERARSETKRWPCGS